MDKCEQYYVVIPNQEPYLTDSLSTEEYNRAELVVGMDGKSSNVVKFRYGKVDIQDG